MDDTEPPEVLLDGDFSEDDISISSEEEDGPGSFVFATTSAQTMNGKCLNTDSKFSIKSHESQQQSRQATVSPDHERNKVPNSYKDEIDVDASLYFVSDLEDMDDSGSDISFTDVPALLTTEDEPPLSPGMTFSRFQRELPAPVVGKKMVKYDGYDSTIISAKSQSENATKSMQSGVNDGHSMTFQRELPAVVPVGKNVVKDDGDLLIISAASSGEYLTSDVVNVSHSIPESRENGKDISESVKRNGHHIKNANTPQQEANVADQQRGNALLSLADCGTQLPDVTASGQVSQTSPTMIRSEQNRDSDSVIDASTDGEGSVDSRHKEILIDYRRSLHRKNSNGSDQQLSCNDSSDGGGDNISQSSSVDVDSTLSSYDSGVPTTRVSTPMSKYLVVVAIDFGTTYSGYAFAFTRDPENIHMMRRWEGGDPGVSNIKTPTTLLLTPDRKFHSFGFGARDIYHDLEPSEAKKYLYFEKFKMKLYNNEALTEETEIRAANGKSIKAIEVFSFSLKFFKDHVMEELTDQLSTKLTDSDICWVITVPAIWKAGAKQFMRSAAYNAGLTDFDNPERVIIALEPEAASIFCRKIRLRDCVLDEVKRKSVVGSMMDWQIGNEFEGSTTKYIVVDCGGGTVDLAVHELDNGTGVLKELHKGTGGPCGATGVDVEFEKLLKKIFGKDFMEQFKNKRPAGWVDLMIAFEAKKRNASPSKNTWLNLALPFSFIDYYKKHHKTSSIESAVRKYGDPNVKWSSQGMLRLAPEVMNKLFQPVLQGIVDHVHELLSSPNVNGVQFLFLVGGFAESPLLQHAIQSAFSSKMRVVIPVEVGLTILKGAVLFGLDPTVIRVRRTALTYGVGVLNKFIPGKHPREKIVRKNGVMWCTDIFDKFVTVDQPITLGDKVTRSYAPARAGQTYTMLNVYCSEDKDAEFISDAGVRRCGQLRIEMPELDDADRSRPRELQATMLFWDTEIKVSAMDVRTGKEARARIDFLSS